MYVYIYICIYVYIYIYIYIYIYYLPFCNIVVKCKGVDFPFNIKLTTKLQID